MRVDGPEIKKWIVQRAKTGQSKGMKLDGLKKYKRSCPGILSIRVKETGSTAFDVIFQGDFTLLVKQ